jgi:adenylate kinase
VNSSIGRVVVLLGAPGAGKGTQAQILSEKLGLAHVATGDLFRAAVRDETPLGLTAKGYMDRGELVPDAVTIEMLLDRLAKPDAAAGILLDGFPRNTAQAEVLDKALSDKGGRVDVAPLIEVPEPELVARLGGRWICRASGHPYHLTGQAAQQGWGSATSTVRAVPARRRQAGDGSGSTAPAARRPGPGRRLLPRPRRPGCRGWVHGGIEQVSKDLLAAIEPGHTGSKG